MQDFKARPSRAAAPRHLASEQHVPAYVIIVGAMAAI
jgi:hypothetical protein